MAKVPHRFGLWVQCTNCSGRGIRKGAVAAAVVCPRCNGEEFVPLIVTPTEMNALLAGGHVESAPDGKYRVLAKDAKDGETAQ